MIRPRILESGTERVAGIAGSKPAVKPVPPAKKPAKAAFTMRHLWRMTVWGGVAAGALFVAVLTSRSEVGTQRVAGLFSGRSDRTQLAARPLDAEVAERRLAEERRLADAVRGLAVENDQLKSRLAAVERNVDDITGSVARQIEAIKKTDTGPADDRLPPAAAAPESGPALAGAPPAPIPVPASSAVMTAAPAVSAPPPESVPAQAATAEPLQSRTAMPAPAAPPPKPAAPAAAKYGVDIGSAVSIEVLRARWLGIHSAHSKLFEGLIPAVTLRQVPRSGRAELRLVVGPLANAEAAAKLCAALALYRLACQPTLLSGQHIALQ